MNITATRKGISALFAIILVTVLLMPHSLAAESYTRDNFLFTHHTKPVSFTQTASGAFFGVTEDGTSFQQVPVISQAGFRLHRFQIDQAFFYVSDHGTFQASTDLMALSIYSYLQSQPA